MFAWKKQEQVPSDTMGRDPGWYAAMDGDYAVLKKRLDEGLDVNHAGKDGMTMLLIASHYGRRKAVKLLIERGANANLGERKFDNPPLWEATREACCAPPSNGQFDTAIIADLLLAGADPYRLNKVGKAPPGWAEGDDERRRAVQAIYRAHGYEGDFTS